MADWSRAFDDPIPLSRGPQLVTLKDAANYIQKLPKAEQDLEEWQAAVEALLLVVELNGPTMMAHIGFMRALNRNVERTLNSSRKDTHWGKHKLKRGE
jgi:cob(I)alamin adenosyltransferase